MKLRVVLAVVCVALMAAPAFAEIEAQVGLTGDVETNTTVQFNDYGGNNDTSWANNGRTHLKISGRVEGDNGWFAYGEGDAMIAVTGTTGVDNAYLQFGTEGFSTLVGRYEAPGAFNKGQDTYIAGAPGAPGRYQGDYARGRFPINNIAFKFSGGWELGLIIGGLEDSVYGVFTDADGNLVTGVIDIPFPINAYGIRPVWNYSGDTMAAKAAVEYITYMPQNTDGNDYQSNRYGASGVIEGKFGGSVLGLSLAYGAGNGKDEDGDDFLDQSTLSTFLYWTMAVGEANSFGLGGGYTAFSVDKFTDDTMFETFVSFNQQLPVEGLKIKYAASYAGASFDRKNLADPDDTSAFGVRVRLNFDF